MIIREKGYAHWDGELKPRRFPWWPITRLGIRLAFKKRNFRFFYVGSFLPSLVFLVGIYISERIQDFKYFVKGTQQILEVNPAYFKAYFTADVLPFMVVMLLVVGGAGLIADDLKYNSLQLYFARPLQKKDYLLGKAAVLVFFVLTLTLVPGLLFIIFKLLFSGSFRFLIAYPWLPLSVVVYSSLLTAFFCLYGLFLSALSKNRRLVAILIFAVYLLSNMLFGIFYENFRNPVFALVSISANLKQVGAWVFKQKPPYAVPWYWSLLVLLSIGVLAYAVLKKRIRSVEVVR
jgi:ABC-type transport system involved in multi-copper enzyme maturation permease subunit